MKRLEEILEQCVSSWGTEEYKVYGENKDGLEQWYEAKLVHQAMKEYAKICLEKAAEEARFVVSRHNENILEIEGVCENIGNYIIEINKESITNIELP